MTEPLEPGGSVGRYKVMEQLGDGDWGAVYKVRHTATHAYHVARFPPALSERSQEALREEARVQRLVFHPKLLPILDVHEDGARSGIFREFVDGTSLADVLAEGPMDPGEAVPLFEQILVALLAAHTAGLVHEALAPQSVLLAVGPSGVSVRVADFGLWRVLGGADATPIAAGGRQRYVAPELLLGASRRDPRADVFSLGCVFYEMLTGRAPFNDGTRRGEDGGPNYEPLATSLIGCPLAIAAVVERALELDPEERYPDVNALAADLHGDPAPVRARAAPQAPVLTASPADVDPDEPTVEAEPLERPSEPLPEERPPMPAFERVEADGAAAAVRWVLQFVLLPIVSIGALLLAGAWQEAGTLRTTRDAVLQAQEVVNANLAEEVAAGGQLVAWGAPAVQLSAAADEAHRAETLSAKLDADQRLTEALDQDLKVMHEPREPEDVQHKREIERMVATNHDHIAGYRAAQLARETAEAGPFVPIADALGLAGVAPPP